MDYDNVQNSVPSSVSSSDPVARTMVQYNMTAPAARNLLKRQEIAQRRAEIEAEREANRTYIGAAPDPRRDTLSPAPAPRPPMGFFEGRLFDDMQRTAQGSKEMAKTTKDVGWQFAKDNIAIGAKATGNASFFRENFPNEFGDMSDEFTPEDWFNVAALGLPGVGAVAKVAPRAMAVSSVLAAPYVATPAGRTVSAITRAEQSVTAANAAARASALSNRIVAAAEAADAARAGQTVSAVAPTAFEIDAAATAAARASRAAPSVSGVTAKALVFADVAESGYDADSQPDVPDPGSTPYAAMPLFFAGTGGAARRFRKGEKGKKGKKGGGGSPAEPAAAEPAPAAAAAEPAAAAAEPAPAAAEPAPAPAATNPFVSLWDAVKSGSKYTDRPGFAEFERALLNNVASSSASVDASALTARMEYALDEFGKLATPDKLLKLAQNRFKFDAAPPTAMARKLAVVPEMDSATANEILHAHDEFAPMMSRDALGLHIGKLEARLSAMTAGTPEHAALTGELGVLRKSLETYDASATKAKLAYESVMAKTALRRAGFDVPATGNPYSSMISKIDSASTVGFWDAARHNWPSVFTGGAFGYVRQGPLAHLDGLGRLASYHLPNNAALIDGVYNGARFFWSNGFVPGYDAVVPIASAANTLATWGGRWAGRKILPRFGVSEPVAQNIGGIAGAGGSVAGAGLFVHNYRKNATVADAIQHGDVTTQQEAADLAAVSNRVGNATSAKVGNAPDDARTAVIKRYSGIDGEQLDAAILKDIDDGAIRFDDDMTKATRIILARSLARTVDPYEFFKPGATPEQKSILRTARLRVVKRMVRDSRGTPPR